MTNAAQTSESLKQAGVDERALGVNLERRVRRAEVLLIALTIAAIAYGDWLSGPKLSIGFLYLVPLSLAALTQNRRTTGTLVLLCVFLRQLYSPIELSPPAYFWRDLALSVVFLSLATAMTRLSRRRREFFEQARTHRDELIEEVRLAAEVQQNILERNIPPQGPYDIVAKTDPARVVGGDYYDFVRHPDGALGVVIADVAGKGLSAAMLMPAVDVAMQTLALRYSNTAEALQELNQVLHENTGAANYATVFYALIEPDSGRMRYANAGHLPGLVLRDGAEEPEWLSASGTPVGLLPGARFEEAETVLGPGDLLVLYSDGVAEEENESGEQFGSERLVSAALEARAGDARAVVQTIRRAVNEFRYAAAPCDDVTVIAVKAPPSPSEPGT